MNEKISIILPVYNGQDYLEEALTSIENQSYLNFEVIIINDASTDKTEKIAEGFCNRDSRFNLYNNRNNIKLPKSLNKGHRLAKGNFLTWTSHDNILKPNFLQVLLLNIINLKADLVYSNYDIIFNDGKLKRKHITSGPAHLPFGNVVGASFMYSKELFIALDGYNEDLFLVEDYDFWLRAYRKFNLFHIKENLYKYRLHLNSLTSNISKNKEYNKRHKTAIHYMFQNLITKAKSGPNYSGLLYESYFGELKLLHLNDLISLRKDGEKIFKVDKNEWNFVVNKKIRELLIKSEVNRLYLVKLLLSNFELLSYKFSKRKSFELLKKIVV
jgi:glycosyltransferase involved in cell wall biosynthesis